MHRDLEKILIPRSDIAARVRELGARVAADLQVDLERDHARGIKGVNGHLPEERIILIPILTGSIVFVADLIREMPLKLSIEVVGVSSYPGKSMESKGVSIRHELPKGLEGKHVIIVDDILDSGQTLDVVTRLVREQRPSTVRTCVLLRKPGKARVDFKPDYVGFDIPDEFVVGYGLDYDGFYRNYPEIATLKPEAR
jgi:hypoxanthine phosphoribosyltransferase